MKKSLGFTLVEMMVVLLIVAVLAAAAAPIVNKRFVDRSLSGGNNHPWEEFTNGIFHNPNTTVGILTDGITNRNELLNAHSIDNENRVPQITLGGNYTFLTTAPDGSDVVNEEIRNISIWNQLGSISISNLIPNQSSIIAIGDNAYSNTAENAITIGGLTALNENPLNINMTGPVNNQISLGYGALALNSIAIGAGAVKTPEHGLDIPEDSEDFIDLENPDYHLPQLLIELREASSDVISTAADGENAIAIGQGAQAGENAVAVGPIANSWTNSVAIGFYPEATENSVAIGSYDQRDFKQIEINYPDLIFKDDTPPPIPITLYSRMIQMGHVTIGGGWNGTVPQVRVSPEKYITLVSDNPDIQKDWIAKELALKVFDRSQSEDTHLPTDEDLFDAFKNAAMTVEYAGVKAIYAATVRERVGINYNEFEQEGWRKVGTDAEFFVAWFMPGWLNWGAKKTSANGTYYKMSQYIDLKTEPNIPEETQQDVSVTFKPANQLITYDSYTAADDNSIAIGTAILHSSNDLNISTIGNYIVSLNDGDNEYQGNGAYIGNYIIYDEESGRNLVIGNYNRCNDSLNSSIGNLNTTSGNDFLIGNKIEGCSNGIGIGTQLNTKTGVTIGNYSQAVGGIAIGNNAYAEDQCIAIGKEAYAQYDGYDYNSFSTIAIGHEARVKEITLSSTTPTGHTTFDRFYPDITLGSSEYWVYLTPNVEEQTIENVDFSLQINDTVMTSDIRLKNVGEVFKAGLEEIKKLEPFNFTFKKDKEKTPHVGVIAQDLQKIFPNAVTKGDDGFLRIRMDEMFYALVNAVKELSNMLDSIVDNEFASLKLKFAKVKERNNELLKENEALLERLELLEKKLK